jgi:hypothetical protein
MSTGTLGSTTIFGSVDTAVVVAVCVAFLTVVAFFFACGELLKFFCESGAIFDFCGQNYKTFEPFIDALTSSTSVWKV